jgi:hypothetical protein
MIIYRRLNATAPDQPPHRCQMGLPALIYARLTHRLTAARSETMSQMRIASAGNALTRIDDQTGSDRDERTGGCAAPAVSVPAVS